MAKTFPLEAKIIALKVGISFEMATKNAASDEKGRRVAAPNAAIKRAISLRKALFYILNY